MPIATKHPPAAAKPPVLLESSAVREVPAPRMRTAGAASWTAESRPRDVRRKRPPALSFLLRWDTARRASRLVVLLALDFVGVSLAIFTALAFKALVHDQWNISDIYATTRQYVSFAYLVTVLMFARSHMYARREERPGLTRILASLSEVTLVVLIFAVVSGQQFASYYIFYGSFAFAVLYVSSLRWACEWASGELLRAAGYRRRAVIVGSGGHIEAVAKALASGPHPVGERRRFHFARAATGQRPAFARITHRPRGDARCRADRRGHNRRPGVPAGARRGPRR